MKDLSTHGIVALVRDKEGKFLLLEDSREQMRGHWAPPHGRCEPTDISEESAVIREVKEETGINVVPIKCILTQAADTKVKTVSFWLVSTDQTDVILDDESSASGWFAIDEALELTLYPGTRTFFEKLKSNKIFLS